MREILFRGKRKDNGEWIEGSLIRILGGTVYISPVDTVVGYEGLSEFYEVIPETVGQYVGAEDKNGVKIFEGDIVDGHREKLLIDFECSSFTFKSELAVRELWYGIPIDDGERGVTLQEDYNIIGNVHDNPELMNVK